MTTTAPGEDSKDLPNATYNKDQFRECAACAKPGAPTLCSSCHHNRELISRLDREKATSIVKIAHKKIVAQLCYVLSLLLNVIEASARETYGNQGSENSWDDDWFMDDSGSYLTFSHARMVWNNFRLREKH